MFDKYSEYLSYLAHKAMLYEVSASPKPGLVDRFNAGAHKDMDFFTFMSSSASLSQFFSHCATAGESYHGSDLRSLFSGLRNPGIAAEKKMFHATGNINTHKGAIFSIGTICAAAGYLYGKDGNRKISAEKICDIVALMTEGLCNNELKDLDKSEKFTAGENLFRQYGYKGIRGEVESGFETVRNTGLKELRTLAEHKDVSVNNKLLQVLLSLMTQAVDSNILHRHNYDVLTSVQKKAKELLAQGGVFHKDFTKQMAETDVEFTAKNVSPGGSADLLAVTILLGMIEGIEL